MKSNMRKILAMIIVFALTLSIGVIAYAADDIALDGDDMGGSSFVGEYSASGAEYKYLGYVTTKGATSDYKYLKITYKGDITTLRLEFHRADDSLEGPYWFNKQDQTKFFVLKNGKDIPLNVNKETTIKIDLKASGVDIGEFAGMHLHYLGPDIQEGSFEIIDAKLMANSKESPGVKEETTVVEESSSENTESIANVDDTTGTEGTAGGAIEPTGKFPIWPIVVIIVVAGGVVAGATFVVSKKLKKED